jgi:hypothetical protein
MSYSINNETKIATYNGVEYTPKSVKIVGSKPTLVALTEEECKEEKQKADDYPNYALQRLRKKRNALLAKTDWMSLPDAPTMSDAWKKYRQDLRDITKTYKSMQDEGFTFPKKPTE